MTDVEDTQTVATNTHTQEDDTITAGGEDQEEVKHEEADADNGEGENGEGDFDQEGTEGDEGEGEEAGPDEIRKGDVDGDWEHKPDSGTIGGSADVRQLIAEMQEMKKTIARLEQDNVNSRVGGTLAGRISSREWFADERITALPTVSTAPILVLNGPRDAAVTDWLVKRDNLIKKWVSLDMYVPALSWGKSATAVNKIQMVCLLSVSFCCCVFVHVFACVSVCVCSVAMRAKHLDGRPPSSIPAWST